MKWVIVALVVIVVAIWLARGRRRGEISDPEVKEVDQKRFYVAPPDKNDPPSEDHRGDSL